MIDNSVADTEALETQVHTVLTWNIESTKNNIFLLKEILEQELPSFAFISEPQVFQADINIFMDYIKADYCHFLNSEDLHDTDIPMVSSHPVGGTLCLWRRGIDPYISVHNVASSSFTPLIFAQPNHQKSIHVGIYLPTHGKDVEFVSELASLEICLQDLLNQHPGAQIFVRGDANVNAKNTKRVALLQTLINKFSLNNVPISHKTYHHFTGGGAFDSNVDVLLHSTTVQPPESIVRIICKNDNPLVRSHHDIILSSFTIQPQQAGKHLENLVVAPRISVKRVKIQWDPLGIAEYQQLVAPHLQQIRDRWSNPHSLSSMSVLLKMTNTILSSTASATNFTKVLSDSSSPKSKRVPKSILRAQRSVMRKYKVFKVTNCSKDLIQAKLEYRNVVRQSRVQAGYDRDRKLFEILKENPNAAFSYIKSCRRKPRARIECLKVGKKLYQGSAVADGFYDSMSSIKRCNLEELLQNPKIVDHLENHENILKLCQDKRTIPPIDMVASTNLLKRMKKKVADICSITALHYLNAGSAGLEHFNFLINAIISDTNNATIEELNMVHGLIYHKGHNKDKTSDN